MRLHRFIVENTLFNKSHKITKPEIVNQIKRVLRLKKGEDFIISNGQGHESVVTISAVTNNFIEIKTKKKTESTKEPQNKVTLYCSILKKENFELVAQKATEVGVSEIYPLISDRTVKLNLNQARLEKIILEAAEQSGRGIIPVLHDPLTFAEASQKSSKNDLNLFFEPTAKNIFDKKLLKGKNNIGVFVGPEGGWSEEEIKEAEKNTFKNINLGKLILRGETAAIIASFLAAAEI